MIKEINGMLGTSFEKALFKAALKNLEDTSNPLRLNNYSYSMRELTRHVLHRLAPETNVVACSWYKNETDKEDGVTRKQRAIYAVQGGLSDSYVEDVLGLEVDKIHTTLIRVIKGLNKFTHIEPNVFDLPGERIENLVNETTKAVYDFLTTINECRALIVDKLWEHIDSAVIDETLRETIIEIDELASHSYIDEVYTDTIVITEIDHRVIKFMAEGSIGCELQWGSNSDIRKGDGAVLPQSFPYQCQLTSPVDSPDEVEVREDSFGVDTSSWTDTRYGQDEQA
ncbi:hypothetical protein EZI54_22955 [Marinobacter halodurans]|uniref:Uncharacterized protein n=1 Tax=Marinobacter halodurans TaxID=2528979 RepID=A0ABY1ZDG9_9GAMM|nr:hypothetical protein [Marinobacter halodurans]TBW46901.1 hypothetical protein EZI54_22955 [Marinobacter halodurans]